MGIHIGMQVSSKDTKVRSFLFLISAATILLTSCSSVERLSPTLVVDTPTPTEIATASNQKQEEKTVTEAGQLARETRDVPESIVDEPEGFSTIAVSSNPTPSDVYQHCFIDPSQTDGYFGQGDGLVFAGDWGNEYGIGILGGDDVETPLEFMEIQRKAEFLIEPVNKHSFAFLKFLDVSDLDKDVYTIELIQTDIFSGTHRRIVLESVSASPYADTYWLNDYQIIYPLKSNENGYGWIIWSPFEDLTDTIYIELPEIGEAESLWHVSPIVDPRVELVVFPCEECANAEYMVRDLHSNSLVWKADLGTRPDLAFPVVPVWSPDGEFVAFLGEDSGNHSIYVFSRDGEFVFNSASDVTQGEMISAYALSWAPNSSHLAFGKITSAGEDYPIQTLAYLSLEDELIKDTCIIFEGGPILWSPDSMKLAISTQIESGDMPRFVSIFDVESSDIAGFIDNSARRIVGWVETD